MKNFCKNIREVVALFILLLPLSLSANSGGFIIQNPILKGNSKATLFELVTVILDFVMKIGLIIVICAVVYSGFLFIKAQGDEGEITTAKKTFYWSVIGGVVLLGAKVLAGVVCRTALSLGATGLTGQCI
jgi:hypothetical protein